MNILKEFLSYSAVISLLGVIGIFWVFIKNGIFTGTKESMEIIERQRNIWKEEVELRETTHKEEINRLIKTYEEQIKNLQDQINTMNIKIVELEKTNEVYKNTVTGRQDLEIILKILSPVPKLFETGGLLDIYKQNDEKIIRGIEELKKKIGNK